VAEKEHVGEDIMYIYYLISVFCWTLIVKYNTVWCATTNDATTNECYNEQFLSVKSGCYNKCGRILFIVKSSIIVFTRERLFVLFMCV